MHTSLLLFNNLKEKRIQDNYQLESQEAISCPSVILDTYCCWSTRIPLNFTEKKVNRDILLVKKKKKEKPETLC